VFLYFICTICLFCFFSVFNAVHVTAFCGKINVLLLLVVLVLLEKTTAARKLQGQVTKSINAVQENTEGSIMVLV